MKVEDDLHWRLGSHDHLYLEFLPRARIRFDEVENPCDTTHEIPARIGKEMWIGYCNRKIIVLRLVGLELVTA